jgi:hypothetical protein
LAGETRVEYKNRANSHRRLQRRIAVLRRLIICLFFSFATWAGSISPVYAADRPASPQLLPKETLVYLRIRDTQELVARFNETALGKIGQEEKIKPLVADLYGSAAEAFAQIEDEVGLPLEKILALPQGEVVVSLIAPRQGRPAVAVIIDIGDQQASAEKLLEKADAAITGDGGVKKTEAYGDVELTIYEMNEGRDPVIYFFKEGTLVATTNLVVAQTIVDAWSGKFDDVEKRDVVRRAAADDEQGEAEEPVFVPLAENEKFIAIMNRCKGAKDDPAQFTWYVDPIALVRVSSRGNVAAQTTLAFLPVLGLDGFQAVGGSLTFASGDFDMITHLHVLLEEPRTGVLEMLAMDAGDTTPENWVPNDVGSYTTLNWDAQQTYRRLRDLYDSIRGEGRLDADVKARISDPLGIEFETEVIDAFGGRATYITWYERPARIGSEAALIGVRLKDPKAFQATFDKLTDKYAENLEKGIYGGVNYWSIKMPEMTEVPAEGTPDVTERDIRRAQRRRDRQETLRTLRPSPCFAIIDDYLIVADRTAFLEKVIVVKSDPSLSLAGELDFKLIASKIKRQVDGAKPGFITFSRPEEGFKVLYEMATGDETRKRLAEAATDNGFFGALDGALTRNELPPFAVLAQYLAPSGGMITSDETGFHYTGFVLQRK